MIKKFGLLWNTTSSCITQFTRTIPFEIYKCSLNCLRLKTLGYLNSLLLMFYSRMMGYLIRSYRGSPLTKYKLQSETEVMSRQNLVLTGQIESCLQFDETFLRSYCDPCHPHLPTTHPLPLPLPRPSLSLGRTL